MDLKPVYDSYAEAIRKEHRATISPKEQSSTQNALNVILRALGITEGDEYLTRYATVLWHPFQLRPKIWVPWNPATGGQGDWRARLVTLTHEATHCEQIAVKIAELGRSSGGWAFNVSYINSTKRADLEASAYKVSLAAEYILWGNGRAPVMTPALRARLIEAARRYLDALENNYALPPTDFASAKRQISEVVDVDKNVVHVITLQSVAQGSHAIRRMVAALRFHNSTP